MASFFVDIAALCGFLIVCSIPLIAIFAAFRWASGTSIGKAVSKASDEFWGDSALGGRMMRRDCDLGEEQAKSARDKFDWRSL